MIFRIIIAAFTAALFLEGCNREIANRNLEQVRLNMSPKEVETILGQPNREKKEEDGEIDRKTATVLTYYYEQGNQTIVLHFQNGHLVKEPDHLVEH
jgi:muramoyltetrapeptide carboxypeptidase LdcA involved in peptidoglycan recycling